MLSISCSENGMKHCLRLKIDMQAPNNALRDPVAFRCNTTHHWRTGHTYKVRHRMTKLCMVAFVLAVVSHVLCPPCLPCLFPSLGSFSPQALHANITSHISVLCHCANIHTSAVLRRCLWEVGILSS